MSDKKLNNDDLKKIEIGLKGIEESFKQFERFENLIPLLGKYLDHLDEKINPLFELAKKAEVFFGKILYIKSLMPLLQKLEEDKEKDKSFI
ncbi:MAG: hypothetical protein ACFE8A_13285 [Candidatus Hodarchaeota archaeon]